MRRAVPRHIWTALAGGATEWLFAILPLIIISIVMIHLQQIDEIFSVPEWAFGASVLGSQALVKFVGGVSRTANLSLERVVFVATLIVVTIIGPANIVLALGILHAMGGQTSLSTALIMLQGILFAMATIAYFLMSVLSHLWSTQSTVDAHV